MKGISAIVATLLLLLITMGLATVAYFYISGVITGRTSKVISVLDASCSGGTITFVISNDGSVDITDAEIRVLIDNIDKSGNFNFGTISPRNTAVASNGGYGAGPHRFLITSPSNTVRDTVYC